MCFVRNSKFGKIILTDVPLHKKWSFLLRISSVNVTKSAGNCRFPFFVHKLFSLYFSWLCFALCLCLHFVHLCFVYALFLSLFFVYFMFVVCFFMQFMVMPFYAYPFLWFYCSLYAYALFMLFFIKLSLRLCFIYTIYDFSLFLSFFFNKSVP